MRSIIKVLTCVLLALVVFVPIRTSWAHEYTPAEKKMRRIVMHIGLQLQQQPV